MLLHSLKEVFSCVLRKSEFFIALRAPPQDLTPEACGKLQEFSGYLHSDTSHSELHSSQPWPAPIGPVLNKVGHPQIHLTIIGNF